MYIGAKYGAKATTASEELYYPPPPSLKCHVRFNYFVTRKMKMFYHSIMSAVSLFLPVSVDNVI